MADTPDTLADPVADTDPDTSADTLDTLAEQEVDVDQQPSPALLTLAEAQRLCSVSRATLQRRLRAGAIPGAERTAGGSWAIPAAGLIEAGLAPRTTPADNVVDVPVDVPVDLEVELAEAERDHAVELARVQADQVRLLAGVIESLRPMLPAAGEADQPAQERRRWWHRKG
jgi:hypothetical protein